MHLDGRRGRVTKPASHPPNRLSRSIVFNQGPKLPSAVAAIDGDESLPAKDKTLEWSEGAPTSWVSKRDRHMQLINPSVYEKELSLRRTNPRGHHHHLVDSAEIAATARDTSKRPGASGSKFDSSAPIGSHAATHSNLNHQTFQTHRW